jgi:prepilin signal peptidase PulO-like enzyme (type II secretory pathway)
MTPPALYIVAAALFGLCIGSFLNVVIYRLRWGSRWRRRRRGAARAGIRCDGSTTFRC